MATWTTMRMSMGEEILALALRPMDPLSFLCTSGRQLVFSSSVQKRTWNSPGWTRTSGLQLHGTPLIRGKAARAPPPISPSLRRAAARLTPNPDSPSVSMSMSLPRPPPVDFANARIRPPPLWSLTALPVCLFWMYAPNGDPPRRGQRLSHIGDVGGHVTNVSALGAYCDERLAMVGDDGAARFSVSCPGSRSSR